MKSLCKTLLLCVLTLLSAALNPLNPQCSDSLRRYPVNDAGRVQMPDATEDLVEEIGHPLMVQVHVYNLAQAGVHQLHHQIPERRGRSDRK